jgi:asparagine synthase (glutamine-hydrolysing)
MIFNIHLLDNKGFNWTNLNNIWVKGYAFDLNGDYINEIDLAERFMGITNIDCFEQTVKNFNGLFSIVLSDDNQVFIAVDITRTFPIFYTKQQGQWFISDDANFLRAKFNLDIDKKMMEEFLFSGYMLEDKTLVTQIQQVCAHEVVSISEYTINREYFRYAVSEDSSVDFMLLQKELFSIYKNVGRRLVISLKGRVAVLPLSGGYDSRLVLTLLKEQGYQKIICFSYGAKSSHEISIATDVAKSVGVQFIKIDYSQSFIESTLNVREFLNYKKYAGNLASLPHIQDFLAVKHLKQEGLIPDDAVFIPGIAGDIFSGSQIPGKLNRHSIGENPQTIIKNMYLKLNNNKFTETLNICTTCFDYSVVENFCVKEKVPKFIANSVRVYDFLGFSYLLPLMDKELLTFFSKVPVELKNRNKKNYSIDSNLYDSTNFIIFDKYNIAIKKNDIRIVFARYFNFLKKKLGISIDSLNNYDYIILFLEKNLDIDTGFKINKNTNLVMSKLYLKILTE